MICTRRIFGKMAAAALSGASLPAKPSSKFQGVQIGAITYSFRQLPSTADSILKYCTELGISSIELMGDVAESYAGAPGNGPRAGRGPATPEQQAAIQNAAEERQKWRLSVSMEKYKALRAMYHQAGVNIDVFKLPLTAKMSGDEYEYVFNATKAIGARSITMELPADTVLTKRLGEFAKRHDVY
ncbi:MAG TPA: hypothetical protein VMZ52_16605, partial [Bryobacteraceae bacterium]|nr:hypothetical protein [Bryobacteraceae bacterium]